VKLNILEPSGHLRPVMGLIYLYFYKSGGKEQFVGFTLDERKMD